MDTKALNSEDIEIGEPLYGDADDAIPGETLAQSTSQERETGAVGREAREKRLPDGAVDTGIQNDDAVSGESKSARHRLVLRVAAGCLGIGLLTLLVVAGTLKPNSQGLGTHQQLGLPPCSSRVLLGIRCPSCGMTTSWSYFTRGQWLESAKTNVGGFLLAFFVFYIAWHCVGIVRTGAYPSQSVQKTAATALIAIMVVSFVDWMFRLME